MWAMIPMLRTRSSATPALRALASRVLTRSPPVVRVEDLAGKLLVHVLLAPVARELDQPAHRKRASSPLRYLDRHLVVRAADAPRAHLEHRGHGLDRLLEHVDRRLPRLLADAVQGSVDDRLGGRLLPARHHLVDHLAHETRAVDRIRLQRPGLDGGSTRHQLPRLAPYLERPWR